MKNLLIALSVFCSALTLISCDNNNNGLVDDNDLGSARFSKMETSVAYSGGQVRVLVVWDNAEWRIESEDADGVISDIQPATGGEIGNSGNTIVSFNASENELSTSRLAKLFVVDEATGEKEEILITQETLPFISVNTSTKYQNVVGFGGMYNPAIWLSGEDRIDSDELATMYAPEGQLQYSVLRLMIYPDKTMWDRDVEGALQAQEYGAIVFACPWDCTNALADYIDKDGDGGSDKHLPEKNYEAYADHLIEYVEFMKSKGVNIYAVSVQNEPDMHFTYWTPAEIAKFTAEYGAKIRNAGVKLMTPEACGFSPDYTNAILKSSDAFANTDIVAGHTYQGFTDLSSSYVKGRHDYVQGLYKTYLQPAVKGGWWMTEKLFGSHGDDLESGSYKTWSYNLEKLGLEMHMCMDAYCSAYLYWYLKRFYGLIGDNNKEHGYVAEGEVMKNGYIMGHYAAYASGKTRVEINVPDEDVLATAYVNETGEEITVVALNMSNKTFEAFLELPNEISVHHAVQTNEHDNMKVSETVLSNDQKHVKVEISPFSIYSIRLVS